MPAPVEPPELARLLDYSERSRVGDWSLRSALTRYAQPQPQRVSQVLDLVRRIEWVLHPQAKLLDQAGPMCWASLTTGEPPLHGPEGFVVGLLGAMAELDRLGDVLAGWADDPSGDRPDAEVDAAVAEVAGRLEALGVPQQERVRPPRQGG